MNQLFGARIRAVACLSLALAGGHQALAANLIQNGSFESNSLSGAYCYQGASCTASSWSAGVPTDSFVLINAASAAWGFPGSLASATTLVDGQFVLGLQGPVSSVGQSLTLDAGTYTLSWADANRAGSYPTAQTYSVSFAGAALGSAFSTQAGAGWQSRQLTFTLAQATSGVLLFDGQVYADATTFLDNVSLTRVNSGVVAAVPEPQTYALMVACLAVVGWVSRRRA